MDDGGLVVVVVVVVFFCSSVVVTGSVVGVGEDGLDVCGVVDVLPLPVDVVVGVVEVDGFLIPDSVGFFIPVVDELPDTDPLLGLFPTDEGGLIPDVVVVPLVVGGLTPVDEGGLIPDLLVEGVVVEVVVVVGVVVVV